MQQCNHEVNTPAPHKQASRQQTSAESAALLQCCTARNCWSQAWLQTRAASETVVYGTTTRRLTLPAAPVSAASAAAAPACFLPLGPPAALPLAAPFVCFFFLGPPSSSESSKSKSSSSSPEGASSLPSSLLLLPGPSICGCQGHRTQRTRQCAMREQPCKRR
jgi:hypothetical protein